MCELMQTFNEVFETYKKEFGEEFREVRARSLEALLHAFPGKKNAARTGVYVFLHRGKPLYIGSAAQRGQGDLRDHWVTALRPYAFAEKALRYWPRGQGKYGTPARYEKRLPIAELKICVFCTDAASVQPRALEQVLLQGALNEFNALPEANLPAEAPDTAL